MSVRLVGEAVDRCLNTYLYGTYRAQYNQLNEAIDRADNVIPLTFPVGEIGRGSFIALDDELCFVTDRDQTTNTLSVVRGVRGTTDAPHLPGIPVEVNPRFARFMVREMFRAELDAWPPSLYRTTTVTVTSNGGVLDVGAALGAGFTARGIVRVRRTSRNTTDARLRRTDGYEIDFDLADTGSLTVNLDGDCGTADYQVIVAGDFPTEDLTDDSLDLLDEIGLRPGMIEILELGAAYRLLIGRATPRLFPEAEGQPRNAAEVTAQDTPAFARTVKALHDEAITREARQLQTRYGFGGRN